MLLPATYASFRFPDYPMRILQILTVLYWAGFAFVPKVSGASPEDSAVVVQELSERNWDQLVPQGKEVDAIYGDIVLQNSFIRAVIAKPVATRNANMTVRNVGGCLIDLANRAHESDQLSAFYPGRRAFAFSGIELKSEAASSVDSNGKVSASGKGALAVTSVGTNSQPACSVSYALAQDSRALTVTTTWTNTSAADITLTLEDDLRADAGKEEMPKAPNETEDLFWFHDIYWQQAYGIWAPGFRIRCNSNARESVLVYEPADEKPVLVKPGESFSLTRQIFVNRDLPAVLADFDEARGQGDHLADIRLSVTSHGRPINGARVQIRCGEQDRGTVVTGDDGSARVKLPLGDCTARVSIAGQEFEAQHFNVIRGTDLTVPVDKYSAGIAHLLITDSEGRPMPAKLEFRGNGDTPTPDWGPETGEYFVRNLAYTADGSVKTELASGEYEVTVSRGPEFDAEFTKLRIEHGKTSSRQIKIARVVETPGWVSADFHSHSTPSGDNTSSQRGRVLNLVAEHIEFAPCTEHNRVSTYDHHIDALNLKPFIATVSGIELTGQPLPLNHQNALPLIYSPRTQDGGAPVTDVSPETQIERLAAWDNNSVKLIQQNHPDLGWLFYDRNGDQVPDEGYSRSFALMNVVEIHPIDPLLNPTQFHLQGGKAVGNQTALNWLQLLNQGYRIYGVVNTDAHYNYHGSGGLRIWVKSSADDPSNINSDEIRDASRNGHLIMSNGPYLEASFRESGSDQPPVISGQDLVAKSKKVTATIRVQCPNWFDIDTVIILVNGRRSDPLTFTRESHPDLFRKDTVRFSRAVEVDLTEDAHLVVVTGHRTQVLGNIMGPAWGTQHPTAVSNPVYVDIDGDGFVPNKDTLDIPLPVKFVAAP
jgi:hypothetical protein